MYIEYLLSLPLLLRVPCLGKTSVSPYIGGRISAA